ncbi:MAG TPA: hypothetical protein VGM25_11280 [Caulobacteraceae bacterium]|jgi:hypothetical protein
MARLGLKQILGSLLVFILFAPIVLATGSPAFRLAIYQSEVAGVPLFPALVVALLLVLMVLVWVFSSTAFSEADAPFSDAKGDER